MTAMFSRSTHGTPSNWSGSGFAGGIPWHWNEQTAPPTFILRLAVNNEYRSFLSGVKLWRVELFIHTYMLKQSRVLCT